MPLALDLLNLDRESPLLRRLDGGTHAIGREDRIKFGEIDRARRSRAIPCAIGETRDAGSSCDEW